MRDLRSRCVFFFCLVAMIVSSSSVEACQGVLTSEQSIAVVRAWINGTAPLMQELRNQGVDVVVEKFNDTAALIYLTKFPGYSGYVELDFGGSPFSPEFQILFFFMKLDKLPIKVDLENNGTVSIGAITYSLEILNNQDLINYFTAYWAAGILEILAVDGYLLDVIERCNFGEDFINGKYCFDTKRWANFDTDRVVMIIKSAPEKPNEKPQYEVFEIDYFKKFKEIAGSNKNIVFVDSLEQLVKSQPRKFTIVALIQRMKSVFVNGKPVFEVIKTTDKLWIGNRAKRENHFFCEYQSLWV